MRIEVMVRVPLEGEDAIEEKLSINAFDEEDARRLYYHLVVVIRREIRDYVMSIS